MDNSIGLETRGVRNDGQPPAPDFDYINALWAESEWVLGFLRSEFARAPRQPTQEEKLLWAKNLPVFSNQYSYPRFRHKYV